jgi:hypothetical protein
MPTPTQNFLAQPVFSIGVPNFASVAVNTAGFASHPLGTAVKTMDGRVFKHAICGATSTVAGSLYQSAAPIANHLAQTAPVVAIGASSFSFTPGATAGAANLYAEGYLQVDTGVASENGYTYSVQSHPAITSSTAFTLYLNDTIQVALSASSTVGLVHNPYKNIIVAPTTLTASVAGVAGYIITNAQCGWIQTWGPCSTLINGTPAVSAPVINSATTAGAVDVWTAAAQPTAMLVGHMMQVGVSTKNNFVYLQISQ